MSTSESTERSPEGVSPASPPSANAASAAPPRRPTDLPLLWIESKWALYQDYRPVIQVTDVCEKHRK